MPLGCIPAGFDEFLIMPCKNDFTRKFTGIHFILRVPPFGRSRGKFNDVGVRNVRMLDRMPIVMKQIEEPPSGRSAVLLHNDDMPAVYSPIRTVECSFIV